MSFLDGLFVRTAGSDYVVADDAISTTTASIEPGFIYPVQAQASLVTLTMSVATIDAIAGKRFGIKMEGALEGEPNEIEVHVPDGTLIQNDGGSFADFASFTHEDGGFREWICDADGNWIMIGKLAAEAVPPAETYEDGGDQELDLTNLSGVLATPQSADKLKFSTGGAISLTTRPTPGQVLGFDGTNIKGVDAASASLQFSSGGAVPLTTRPTTAAPFLRFDGTNLAAHPGQQGDFQSPVRSSNTLDEDFDANVNTFPPAGWGIWRIDSTNKCSSQVLTAGVDYIQDARAGDPSPNGVSNTNELRWYIENGWLFISTGNFTNADIGWFVGRRIASRAAHHQFRSRVRLAKNLSSIVGGTVAVAVGKETSGRPDFSAGHSAGWNTSSSTMKPYLLTTIYTGVNSGAQIITQDHEYELNFNTTTIAAGLRGGSLNLWGGNAVHGTGFAQADPIYVGFYISQTQFAAFDYLRERSSASVIPFR